MKELATLITLAAVLATVAATAAAETQPNIIFILTDDQRDNSFSAMDHPWVKTPHVDELLSRSTRFTNAYIAEPTCKPSRAAIYLGCHERVNHQGFSSKGTMNAAQWADSFPALLRKANYYTGFVGKWHISNAKGLPLDSLFDSVEGHIGHGPFFFPQDDGSEVTTNRHHTDNALRFLDSVPDGKPFLLSLCYATPHGSKIAKMHGNLAEPAHANPKLKDHPIYGSLYRDLTFPIPADQPQNPYDHIPKAVMDQDKGRNRTYKYNYDNAMSREHHYRYYQMVTEIDEMVGEIVSKLKASDLSENTVLIFGSDHGLLMGEYGMGGKGLLYDLASKFPCFIFDPKARGQVRDELVSSLDISATVLDYAGVAKPEFCDGHSLRPLVQSTDEIESWRDGLFLENLYTGRDTPIQVGFVENGWKYIRYHKAPHPYAESDLDHLDSAPVFEQLFNLADDPGEVRNLIDSSENTELIRQLQKKTDEALTRLMQRRLEYQERYFKNN